MRNLTSFAWVCGTLLAAVGCTSPRVAVLPPIGPAQGVAASGGHEGFLKVYSAREPAVLNPNAEEFFWNNDFGQNEFLHRAAHRPYDLYSQDGKLIRHVRNAWDINDPQPTLLSLPPGTYQVQAPAEDHDAVSYTAVVPVVIEPGATTEAHLDQQTWTPAQPAAVSSIVRLPNGRLAGWSASAATVASGSPNPRP
jgi:hypothetical protein